MWNRCFAYKDTTRSKFEKAKSDLYLIDFKGDFVVELFVFGAIIGYGVVDDKCFAPCVCVNYFAVVQGAPVVKMIDPAGTGQATNPGRAKAIDVGGARLGMASQATRPVVQIVDGNDEYIGAFLCPE